MTRALIGRGADRSEITCENNWRRVCVCLYWFYFAQMDSNHPTRALNRGTKITTVRCARKFSTTHVSDFVNFLVRKEDSNP